MRVEYGVFRPAVLIPRFRVLITLDSGYSRNMAVLVCSAMVVLFGGLEALLILTLRVCLPPRIEIEWL